ncbi:MAG: cell wall-binding repeat-containing protein [Anaerovoracaceae bacterium]
MKRIIASIVTVLLVFSSIGIQVYAEEVSDYVNDEIKEYESSSESLASDEDIAKSENVESPESLDIANSWRYQDGQLIEENSNSASPKSKATTAYHPDATRQGIDVSKWQGNIDWNKVKASGIDFAIIRCGFGGNYTNQDDQYFKRNVSECERLGIPYGVYLYSYATNTEKASSEADHVLRLIKGCKLSYPVYLDMEDNSTIGSNYASIAKTFCNKITKAGYPVGIYANLNWWNTRLTDSCFDNWHRWVAQYNTSCGYKKNYAMWQYSSKGRVNGISGNVDMNYLIGYPDDHGSSPNLSPVTIDDGIYTIKNKKDSTYSLTAKNNNIQINKHQNMLEQKYEIEQVNDGYYKITDISTGKVMDVANGSKKAGANLRTYKLNSTDAQLWRFMKASDGSYYIQSKLGTYIDVSSNTFSENRNVYLNKYSNTSRQKWILTKDKIIYKNKTDSEVSGRINNLFGNKSLIRYSGKDRYKTAILTADAMKKSLSKSKFETVIVACGTSYPDALAGSYLAAKKQAPILLVNKSYEKEIRNYVIKNLNNNGTVYILGGTGVVSSNFEKELKKSVKVKRLSGKDRYATNLSILKEAGVESDLLLCSGNGYADSLSVASSGEPILLVNKKLDSTQKKFLSGLELENIYLIGGTGVVNKTIESNSKSYGNVIRLGGFNRYTTSIAVSRAFFGEWNKCAVAVYGMNFPDGLTGGALAISLSSPVILMDNKNYNVATVYSNNIDLNKLAVLGGTSLIKDSVAKKMIN